MDPREFFSLVMIDKEDYDGLNPSEAYRTGMEMGCFIQSVAVSQNIEGSAVIRIPSEHAARVEKFLKEIHAKFKIGWVNDDVIVVRIEV